MSDEDRRCARAELSTDELSAIVSEWLARRAGIPPANNRHCEWRWQPGKGPVLRIYVESVPNVTSIDEARKRPTIKQGRGYRR